jgi:hypothetical protein
MLSIWAYAYEFESASLVSDAFFDSESKKVDLTITTTRPDMDAWWIMNFTPHSGMWVRNHPELEKLRSRYMALRCC